MKICFLLTHVPDPRINKRISVAKECGLTDVVCVRRKAQDIWEPSHLDVNHIIFDIDLPSSKHIIKRTIMSQEFKMKALRELERINPDVLYCDGFDSLLIACKYKNKKDVKLIYEVADLREGFIEKPKSFKKKIAVRLLSQIEKKSFENISYLVLTSMKFFDAHYNKLISKKRVIYAPNIPDFSAFSNYNHKSNGDFTIGFIGGIRYLKQMKMLVDAAGNIGCKVIFAGAGGTSTEYEEIIKYCENKPNVSFTGRYDYQMQIASLYGEIDCVYAVYDASNPNVRIALPNKLYEAVYCGLPLIVAKNTYLSEIVDKYGIGYSVDYISTEELSKCIQNMMLADVYRKLSENCKVLSTTLLRSNWDKELTDALTK